MEVYPIDVNPIDVNPNDVNPNDVNPNGVNPTEVYPIEAYLIGKCAVEVWLSRRGGTEQERVLPFKGKVKQNGRGGNHQ
jgi:hypothetical protein